MAKAVPYIAAAATFVFTGSFQAAQAAFVVSSAVMGVVNKPKTSAQASQERQASVVSLSFGEVPREALLGHTITGGSLVDGFNHGGQYGTDNVTLCIALADHPMDAPQGFWIAEQRFPFVGNGDQPSHGGALSMEFRQATATGHAPPAVALANGWDADDRLASIAHIWVTYRTDEKVWTQGHPQFRFDGNGLRVYDPRRDRRFGYTGPDPQTWEDISTHTNSQNAALNRYAITRGIYAVGHQGDPAYLLIGRGLSEEEAPPHYTIAAANLCDEIVDGLPRYLAQGTIRATDPFIAVEGMFATAMAGTIIQREGAVEVEPGQPKAALVTITDADLVAGEPVSYSGFLPDTNGGRVNTVVPRFTSPGHNWQDHAGPVRRNVVDVIRDGGPREMTLSMPMVAWEDQAGRVAEITRRMARLERRMSIVLPPEYGWLEEGDWIAVQSDRRHGGATYRYRIEAWSLDRGWRMRLTLREISASVFGGVDEVADQAEPPALPTTLSALALRGVSIEAAQSSEDSSAAIPGISFGWDLPVDRALRQVRAEIRPVDALADVSSSTTGDVATDQGGRNVWVVTNGVQPGVVMEARLVPIGEHGRPVLATPWTEVKTGKLIADDLAPGAQAIREIADDVLKRVEALFSQIDGSEKLAEILLETILNEYEALQKEAKERNEGIAKALFTSLEYADEKYAQAELSFVAVAAFEDALAISQQTSRAYTDAFKAEANQTFATIASLNGGLASTLQQANSYSDGVKAYADLSFYTKAQTDSGLATTLQQARSYSDGQYQQSQLIFSTKTETAAARAQAVQEAKSYTDSYKTEASLLFATQTALDGVNASAALALSTSQSVDGRIKSLITLTQSVDGLISGIFSENNGAIAAISILSSVFNLYSTGSGAQTSYIDGRWYILDPAEGTLTIFGLPFGGAEKLVWWTGSSSVGIGGAAKGNAAVYISMNAVGGPRFGGSDVPTGGGGGGDGSGIINFGGQGNPVTAPAKNLPAGTQLKDMVFSIGGGSITNPNGINVLIGIYANNIQMHQETVTVPSQGLQNPDGSWVAGTASLQVTDQACPASGSVQFSMQILAISGGSFSQAASMSGQIFAVLPI